MISQSLHQYIKDKGVKQAAIARAIGITAPQLSIYLTGKTRMPADVFLAICQFIEVDPSRFATDKTA